MHFAFTEEQGLIKESVESFLKDWADDGGLRRAATSGGFDLTAWQTLTQQLGLGGVLVPEAQNGSSLGHVERSIVMEALGYAQLPVPFFSSCCMATDLLLAANDPRFLKEIALGQMIATAGFLDGPAEGLQPIIEPKPNDHIHISGRLRNVPDGGFADLLVIVAQGQDDALVFAVPTTARGIERMPVNAMDPTRPLMDFMVDVTVPLDAIVGGQTLPHAQLEAALDKTVIALAAEQVGIAQRVLDMSVDYAKERKQFGRIIGSFQAVKHRLADMMVRAECARSAAYYAACIADAETDELGEATAIARITCDEAAFKNAGDAIQMHGGIGFTDEYELHWFFKRARANKHRLGSAEMQLGRLSSLVLKEGRAA